MKAFEKEPKRIMLDNYDFFYIVDERPEDVRFRVYPITTKTTYFEVIFSYKDYYYINLYKPSIAGKLISYAINIGWSYIEEKQIMTIHNGSFLVKLLDTKGE